MREIKFEYGFESVNGIVKKVYDLSEIPNIKEKCDVWNVLPIVYVREFTGLKDKNGKEIYEGDIVRYIIPNDFITDYFSEVKFIEKESKYYPLATVGEKYEVVGNIYENPELLNK